MVTIHMLVGIPASGKTTYASKLKEEFNIPIVSTDHIRNMNPEAKEDQIWPLVYQECVNYVCSGQDFIFDATNITPNVRNRFKKEILKYSSDFVIGTYYFDVDPLVCYNRAIIRNDMPGERYIPPEVILSYGEKIVPPTEEEGFVFRKVIKQ